MQKELGVVKWYNDAKGYGNIVSYNDGFIFLANRHDIENDPKVIFENQIVKFIRNNQNNKLVAESIEVVSSVIENKILDYPRISVFDNVLPHEYCDHLIAKHTAAGMNHDSGGQSKAESFYQVTELVEKRGISLGVDPLDYDILASAIVNVAQVPYANIEAIDIYNYPVNHFLDLHHDYPYDPRQINYYRHGGDRVGTGIFYLNDDMEGGETLFPKLGVSIKPKKGSFLYFQQGYDEETNWATIHESTIITSGCKWISSCFFSDMPRVGYSERKH